MPAFARCIYCKQDRRAIEIAREAIDARFYGDLAGTSDAPCCTPESTYQCPQCGSENLDFGMHYAAASWEDDETREEYRCLKCGSTGDVDEAAPPAQPWNELEAVSNAAAKQRGFEHWDDCLDMVRNAADRSSLQEVA